MTLAKRFKCPFCANEDVVECKMDNKKGIGSLSCRLCGASYQMPIHHLHEPIDVFSEWLDDCEAAERANSGGGPTTTLPSSLLPTSATVGGVGNVEDNDVEDDDDDLLDGPSDFGRASSNGNKNGKSKSSGKGINGQQQQTQATSYADLGLGDSDSDDD